MPRIRPYESQIGSDAGIPAQQAQASDFGGPGLHNLGNAVQQVGVDATHAQRIIAENNSRNAVTDVHTFLSRTNADYTQKAYDVEAHADPSNPNLSQEFLVGKNGEVQPDSLKGYLDAYREQVTDPYARRAFDEGAANLTERFAIHFAGVQSRMASVYAKQQAIALIDSGQTAVQTDPSQYPDVLTQTMRAINDPGSVYGRLSAEQREPIKRQATEQLAKSMVQGLLQEPDVSSANYALGHLEKGTWDNILKGEDKAALIASAQTRIKSFEVRSRQAEAEEEKMKNVQIDQLDHVIFQHRSAHDTDPGNPQFPLLKADDPNLMRLSELGGRGRALADSYLTAIETESRHGEIQRPNHALEYDLFRRITAEPGDKYWDRRIVDTKPINDAYRPNGLSRTQREGLLKDLTEMRSPTGRLLSVEKKDAFESIKPLIMPKDLNGVLVDPLAAGRMEKLRRDVENQMDQDFKAGKNPRLRIDPNASEYMLTPERLKAGGYVKPFMERIRDASARVAEAPGLPKTPQGGVKPDLQRLPGETASQWEKRTGQ